MHPYFQFPESFINIIQDLCLKESGHKTVDDFIKKFSPEIGKISNLFNQRTASDKISSTLSSPHFPLAYIAYFLPSNFFKISALLLDFFKTNALLLAPPLQDQELSIRPIRVLDLGAGPGTNGLGLLDFCARFPEPYFKNRTIHYLAIDQDQRQLNYSTGLFSRYQQILESSLSRQGIVFHYKTLQKKVSTKPLDLEGKFDLIVLGNLLNEMIQNGHEIPSLAEWIKSAMQLLTPQGALFIIEPALRKASRDLLALRNIIALQKIGSIAAPCLHQRPCPIMEPQGSEKDWCHQEKEWGAPAWIQLIDRAIGNRKDAIKYSYLILTPPWKVPFHPPSRWRTVSEVIETKGKKEAFLCNETGRIRFYLLNRETDKSNAPFSTVRRGDLIELNRPNSSGGTRILPDWNVRIH